MVTNKKAFTWVDPDIVPKATHLYHAWDTWCVVNAQGEVLVYDMGTGNYSANALQGNQNKSIAERFVERYKDIGAIGIELIPDVFLPDSPGRY